MIWEILIIASIAGILFILLKHLPVARGKMESYRTEDLSIEPVTVPASTVASQGGAGESLTRAEELFAAGSYREAEKDYLEAALRDPKNPKIYNRLGGIYLELENFEDARDAFLTALKMDYSVASRHVNVGLAELGLKHYQQAIQSFQEALKLEPENAKYREYLLSAQASLKAR